MAGRPQRAAYKEARVLANRLDRGFVRNAGLRLSAQAKEAGPVPGRSGDPARDGREAGMDLSLPMKAARHDHDLMQRAAMLADHDGPDLEMPDRLAPAPGQPIQELAGTGVELAEPLLLELMRTWGQACRATGPGAGCGGPWSARAPEVRRGQGHRCGPARLRAPRQPARPSGASAQAARA